MLEKIYMAWREGRGQRRRLVGVLERRAEGLVFGYLSKNLSEAQSLGFLNYPDFPDLNREYRGSEVHSVFKRLPPVHRRGVRSYYDFWCADPQRYDEFDRLGLTQGRLPTDLFEFLAEYPVKEGVRFTTDVAGLQYHVDDLMNIETGCVVDCRPEPDNEHDPEAVAVCFNGRKIGYIKRIHARFFLKSGQTTATVKAYLPLKTYPELYLDVVYPCQHDHTLLLDAQFKVVL